MGAFDKEDSSHRDFLLKGIAIEVSVQNHRCACLSFYFVPLYKLIYDFRVRSLCLCYLLLIHEAEHH